MIGWCYRARTPTRWSLVASPSNMPLKFLLGNKHCLPPPSSPMMLGGPCTSPAPSYLFDCIHHYSLITIGCRQSHDTSARWRFGDYNNFYSLYFHILICSDIYLTPCSQNVNALYFLLIGIHIMFLAFQRMYVHRFPYYLIWSSKSSNDLQLSPDMITFRA